MSVSDALVLVAALALAWCLYQREANSSKALPFPPGPRPLPVLGNLFDVPTSHEHLTFAKWAKEYGDVVHLNVLGKHIVILNTIDAAKEFLDFRSSISSDRPFIPMLHDPKLMDCNTSFVLGNYSPVWKRQRRLFVNHLGPAASNALLEAHSPSVHTLLRSMLHAPDQFVAHLEHAATDTIFSIAYGYRIQPKDDPVVAITSYVVKRVADCIYPGRFWVNAFPWMKHIPSWVPGAGFKAYAVKTRKISEVAQNIPFEEVKRQMAEGTAAPSFVTNALADPRPDVFPEDIKEVSGVMFGGGTESLAASMSSCILALVLNPGVQMRAHAELDTVLGSPTSPTFRLPTFADRPHLPYIDAIVKETLRWFPVSPTGLAHATTKDDVYRGWIIPKGTIVIANSWQMLLNEKTYPNPLMFLPERFLGENPAPTPASQGCFGFGRRRCAGRHFVYASLWMQIVNILAVYTLSPAKDKDGQDIDVSYAFREPMPGHVPRPQAFPCTISVRSKEAELRMYETLPDGDLCRP